MKLSIKFVQMKNRLVGQIQECSGLSSTTYVVTSHVNVASESALHPKSIELCVTPGKSQEKIMKVVSTDPARFQEKVVSWITEYFQRIIDAKDSAAVGPVFPNYYKVDNGQVMVVLGRNADGKFVAVENTDASSPIHKGEGLYELVAKNGTMLSDTASIFACEDKEVLVTVNDDVVTWETVTK